MSVINAIKQSEKVAKVRNWSKTYWFFDIHATILKPNYEADNIPKQFYTYAKETLQLLSKRDDVCMGLYTCSHPHEIAEYVELFKSHDINFEMINENPEVPTQKTGYGNYDKKPYMNVLFEDKAGFNAEVDWLHVHKYLTTGLCVGDTVELVREEGSYGKIIDINLKSIDWFPFKVYVQNSYIHHNNIIEEFKETQIKKIKE